MAISSLCPGYIGQAEVDGVSIRCSDFSLNPSQDFTFYDHTIGLNDTVPSNNSSKGESVGDIQTQKRIGRPSPISIGGGISFPATQGNLGVLFDNAKYGTYFDVDFQYHRGVGQDSRSFSDCRVNQYTFSITAGDILNISADFLAKDMSESGGVGNNIFAEKLITWDQVLVSSSGLGSYGIQGIEFSVNNNLKNIYTVGSSTGEDAFKPSDIRVGMQEVTGSISVYNIPGKSFITDSTSSSTISISAAGFNTDIEVVFKPQDIPGTLGPVITSIPFVGVDKAFGS